MLVTRVMTQPARTAQNIWGQPQFAAKSGVPSSLGDQTPYKRSFFPGETVVGRILLTGLAVAGMGLALGGRLVLGTTNTMVNPIVRSERKAIQLEAIPDRPGHLLARVTRTYTIPATGMAKPKPLQIFYGVTINPAKLPEDWQKKWPTLDRKGQEQMVDVLFREFVDPTVQARVNALAQKHPTLHAMTFGELDWAGYNQDNFNPDDFPVHIRTSKALEPIGVGLDITKASVSE